jgi:hypothetical protein
MAIDKVVSASITDSAVTDAKLSFNSNQFRNIIGDLIHHLQLQTQILFLQI